MRLHRNFNCIEAPRKASELSIMKNAQMLREAAGQVVQDAIGASTATAESIEAAGQNLARVQGICEESTSTAAILLGEGHSAVQAIVGSAANVTEKVIAIQGMLQNVKVAIIELDALVTAHGGTMQQAAERAMGGGS